jgi:hypothetical protein
MLLCELVEICETRRQSPKAKRAWTIGKRPILPVGSPPADLSAGDPKTDPPRSSRYGIGFSKSFFANSAYGASNAASGAIAGSCVEESTADAF